MDSNLWREVRSSGDRNFSVRQIGSKENIVDMPVGYSPPTRFEAKRGEPEETTWTMLKGLRSRISTLELKRSLSGIET